MRKPIYQIINYRPLYGLNLCLALLVMLGYTNTMSATISDEELPITKVQSVEWVGGTTVACAEMIQLDWSIKDQPADPMEGDSICFNFTAKNLADEVVKNVVILKSGVMGYLAMADSLLANGVMTDNVDPMTGSGTYFLTGSGCSVLTETDIENGYVVCHTCVGAECSDAMSRGPADGTIACVNAMACFGVTLTCTDYNISLDEGCEVLLTPELLAINTTIPDSLLRIRIQEADSSYRDRPMIGSDDVDGKVKVVVDIPGCRNVAPCWSYAHIDYKFGPAQICTTDTVTCARQVLQMNTPSITFACGSTEFIRSETIREDLCHSTDPKDSLFIAKEITTFSVRDALGNISDTCTQVRYILKPNLKEENILWPQDNATLSCEAEVFADDGTILPLFSGVPLWVTGVDPSNPTDTLDLTDRDLPQSCNILTAFEDILELERNCERIIVRRWTVTEWICEGGFNRFNFTQRIVLTDTTAPVITVQAPVIDLTVNELTCSARFDVPRPVVTDNCQPDSTIEVEIRYPEGSSILNPELKTISLPMGDSILVEYIARDRCGNESRDTLYVNVIDNTTPVAICLRNTTISITDSTGTLGIDKIDENSYDPCGIESKCLVRMDDLLLLNSLDTNNDGEVLFSTFDAALQARADIFEGCYRDYLSSTYVRSGVTYINTTTICTPTVTFCCADVGLDIRVVFRVFDQSGNKNECMVMVKVQDKSEPIITCPTDSITVSCDFDFDENGDIDGFFGTIRNGFSKIPLELPREFLVDSSGPLVNGTFVDNCNLGRVIERRIVDRDSICRTGSIKRFFSIVRGVDTMLVCEQYINIVGDEINNPLVWEFFPPDVEIVVTDPDDIRRLAIDNPPVVSNAGCSLIGIGHRDQYFTVSEGSFCTKIVRTWEVIDWCRDPTGRVQIDSVQIIFVEDNEAPEVTFNSPLVLPEPLSGDAVELVATATDNVVENPKWLDWRYEVFSISSTGTATLIMEDTIMLEDFRNSSAVIRLEGLTEGDYRVDWIVMDRCMKTDTAMQELMIVERRAEEESVDVAGQVLFSKGGNMDNIQVFLTQKEGIYGDAFKTITDNDGTYAFESMLKGGQYYIDPEKNDDPLNGVSTLDMLLIQRHILGLGILEDPALQIAADVNGDGNISALDLVELRRLLLGYVSNFSKKDSWSFVYDGQDLNDVATYRDALQETYFIDELVEDMDISFLGIKTGDVSGDAIGRSAGLSRGRSINNISWSYDIDEENGMSVINIKAAEDMSLNGFQANWSWSDDMKLISVTSGQLTLDEEHYNLSWKDEGLMPMSFYKVDDIDIQKGDILFSMTFRTSKASNTSYINLSADRFTNEVYIEEDIFSLTLNKEIDLDHQAVILSQNTPNPWSESTFITADIPVRGEATFRVYDLHNRLIHQERRVVDRGTQVFAISDEQISESGLYFYEVEIGGLIARQKMIRVN